MNSPSRDPIQRGVLLKAKTAVPAGKPGAVKRLISSWVFGNFTA